jgi:hypothetical protein
MAIHDESASPLPPKYRYRDWTGSLRPLSPQLMRAQYGAQGLLGQLGDASGEP